VAALGAVAVTGLGAPAPALAKSEADLVLPDLRSQQFLWGVDGHTLLAIGLVVAVAGILFGLLIYAQLRKLPVHRSMLEVSDLIYETCKTYLLTQGKFILLLWVCIAAVMVAYFGFLRGGHADAETLAALTRQGCTSTTGPRRWP
jgi:K(+)-stimulated pyrophosphate-energized sodium pump